MKFPRIYADEQGETHIGVLDVPEHEARVGPPPNPVGRMTETEAVSTLAIFSAPAKTEVPAHNAPQPYIVIVLAGEGEVETSDGKTLRLGPGELIYCDDTSGKGHVTAVDHRCPPCLHQPGQGVRQRHPARQCGEFPTPGWQGSVHTQERLK